VDEDQSTMADLNPTHVMDREQVVDKEGDSTASKSKPNLLSRVRKDNGRIQKLQRRRVQRFVLD
jgi:hypothetical protein